MIIVAAAAGVVAGTRRNIETKGATEVEKEAVVSPTPREPTSDEALAARMQAMRADIAKARGNRRPRPQADGSDEERKPASMF